MVKHLVVRDSVGFVTRYDDFDAEVDFGLEGFEALSCVFEGVGWWHCVGTTSVDGRGATGCELEVGATLKGWTVVSELWRRPAFHSPLMMGTCFPFNVCHES